MLTHTNCDSCVRCTRIHYRKVSKFQSFDLHPSSFEIRTLDLDSYEIDKSKLMSIEMTDSLYTDKVICTYMWFYMWSKDI